MSKEVFSKDKSERIVYYGCARWRCDAVNSGWETFSVGYPVKRTYCLNHIPLIVKFRMKLKGIS